MSNERRTIIVPPLRCCVPTGDSLRPFCGELAVSMAPGIEVAEVFGKCAKHLSAGDVPIVGDLRVRRVTVRVDALFCAVATGMSAAHQEAVQLLEYAIRDRGGLLNLHDVGSEVVRFSLPAGQERRKGG